ncbi:uncharacterized protein si:cabz01074946.1 isoform X2 [Alosa sapidissima]|uniref:uncharacterized protein si:cabz01074946.1 isoform X2 n=1 Tax=Alosa sapidissima TaxID=34773 RepID=UPI001C0892CE|nr:uncharacterized protein si:cabz01074946.1 isoform X2 [Alosa sapidissima]
MFLVLLLMSFGTFHVHSVLSKPEQVTAYEGDTVTLHSRGKTTWTLSRIQWAIFQNDTLIATYQTGHLETDLIWSYKGRLTLNTTTGDLQIKNVTRKDNKSYSVLLMDNNNDQYNHDIQLNVRAQLHQPILNVSLSAISKDRCMVELRCTSPQEGLHISWDYIRDPVLFAYSGLDKNDSVLWAYLRADTPTNFTCTISDGLRNSSISKQPSCKDARCNCCGRHHYIPAVLVTFYLVLLCMTVSTRMPIRTQQEETHADTQEEQQEETHADTQEEQQEETHADTQEEQQEKTHAETPEEQQGETHPETPEEQQEETHTETQEETHAETHEEQEEETHAETQEEQQEKTHTETPEEQQEETHTQTDIFVPGR